MSTPVVLITGALTGIGRAAALAFAKGGSRVVISGRHEEAGQALAMELHALDAEAEFVPADVRQEDAVRELVDQTVARFGRLDAAVNTAGTEGHPGPVTEQSADSYAATFDTNVLGTLLSMKHELRVMLAQGSGSIINISSTYVTLGRAVHRSIRQASTPSRDSQSRRRWRLRDRGCGSTPLQRDQLKPQCSIGLRATHNEGPALSRVSRCSEQPSLTKSRTQSSSWLRTSPPSRPVRCSSSTAASPRPSPAQLDSQR
jgi:NAD(P)-dependent dehydrogenase (short-subunit alcohol dehydrogenase family)